MRKNKKVKNDFENWYFKLVDVKKKESLGISVGRSRGNQGEEAFIEITGEEMKHSIVVTYPISAVSIGEQGIQIEHNKFNKDYIQLDLQTNEFFVKGEIEINHHQPIKQSLWIPGLMGPFKYLPFLESYHEVISLRNILTGKIKINEKTLFFDDGRGYVEKSWGKAFPKIWVWAQCNHFKKHDMALMVGIARMPFLLEHYTSFAIPILMNDKVEIFSNYNGGHIAKLYRYKGYIHLVVTQKNKVLDIKIYGSDEISCISARSSHMIRDVYSCEAAKVEIKMTKDNDVLFEDIGQLCELEMGGNTSKLK